MRMFNWEGTLGRVEEVWLFNRELRGSEEKSTADTTSLAYSVVDEETSLHHEERGKLHKRAGPKIEYSML